MAWFARIRNRLNSKAEKPAGFLGRLRRNTRGATLPMMAAVVIPMIGMVGSAVDISRAYLVKVRLQQACDAGVLAARRTMTGSTIVGDTNAITQATNFFNINLKNKAYGATVTPITVTDVNDANNKPTGTVHGAASATVPTTLMRVFGKTSIAMTAQCEATLQVANNDVMFVLDVTGSMNCAATDTTCSNNGGVEASNAKIKALRTAVVDFYDTLAAATTSTAQLRIGIVPYSSEVNVGKLLPAGYMIDSFNYQTRLANYTTPQYVANGTSSGSAYEYFRNSYGTIVSISQANCQLFGQNKSFWDSNGGSFTGGSNPASGGGPPPTPTTSTSYANDYRQGYDWGYSGAPDRSGSSQSCRRTATTTSTAYKTVYGFTNWTYAQDTFDTSGFKTGNPVTIANGTTGTVDVSGSYNMVELPQVQGATGISTTTSTWDGCIEERDTVAQTDFSTVPSGAYDLNIDLLPTNNATKWRPHWDDIVWDRPSPTTVANTSTVYNQPTGDFSVCPKQAMKLQTTSHTAVYNYVNASDFKAQGGTYHDVGMIWGGRLISPTGIFSAQNASAPNGQPINRSIVFMTDGIMAPQPTIDGLYGYEKLDRRVSGAANTPTSSDLKDRHTARFSAICEAIKGMNITIYVVAYGQTMVPELQACASANQAYYAADDNALKQTFQRIAKQIAQLRLSK